MRVGAPIIVLGGGGHARVVLDLLAAIGEPVLGVCDPGLPPGSDVVPGVPVLGGDDVLDTMDPAAVRLANGLGTVAPSSVRRDLFTRLAGRGFGFPVLAHPAAVVARGTDPEEGAQVMAGAVVQTGCRIGRNVIVNTRASIDHDCQLDDHVHVAPGSVLSGGVWVGSGSHIGTGTCIIQGVRIGRECLIGAGAVIAADVPDGLRVRAGEIVRGPLLIPPF